MIPRRALEIWASCIADPSTVRVGTTRHRVSFAHVASLDDFASCDWPDAGFTASKLKYLRRKYPVDDLPDSGCIREIRAGDATAGDATDWVMTYRRVDVTRGWLADVMYLLSLGYRGTCLFDCPSVDGAPTASMHAVNVSAIASAVHAAGLWVEASRVLARTLRRAVRHRMERRHEQWAQTRRVNDWAHRVATVEQMRATIAQLDREIG